MKFLTLTLTLASVLTLTAAEQTYDFKDPKGVNHASFKLDAALETISGNANGVSGSLTIDPEKPEATKGSIIVSAESLHVENAMMKEHMHGADWMDVKTHPEIKFTVAGMKNFKLDGDNATADVTGTFSLHGVEKEVTVPAKVTLLKGKLGARTGGKMEGDLIVLRTTFTIKRSDYGINPKAPADKVAEDVEISLAIAGACPAK